MVARCAALSMSGVYPSTASAHQTVLSVGQSGQVRCDHLVRPNFWWIVPPRLTGSLITLEPPIRTRKAPPAGQDWSQNDRSAGI